MRSGLRTNSSDTMKPPDTNSSLYVWFLTSSSVSTPAKLTEGSFFNDTSAGICGFKTAQPRPIKTNNVTAAARRT